MSRHVPARALVGVAALAVLAAGCGSSGPSKASASSSGPTTGTSSAPALTGTITVFAAASLTGTFTSLGKQFEAANPGTKVTFSFGASSTLAQQIIAGAPADAFASASTANMKQVIDAGAVNEATVFATNTAEIAVSPARAGRITGLADLAKPGVKVALCQPQVPCGALAQTVLAKAKVSVAPVTQGLDVKSTLAYVTGGEADAAIVYVTDVKAAGAAVAGVQIAAADNASTAYPMATVKAGKNAPVADAFEELVLSPAGQKVLTGAGFSIP